MNKHIIVKKQILAYKLSKNQNKVIIDFIDYIKANNINEISEIILMRFFKETYDLEVDLAEIIISFYEFYTLVEKEF